MPIPSSILEATAVAVDLHAPAVPAVFSSPAGFPALEQHYFGAAPASLGWNLGTLPQTALMAHLQYVPLPEAPTARPARQLRPTQRFGDFIASPPLELKAAAEASSESREAAACAPPSLLQDVTNQQTGAMGSTENLDLDSLMLRITQLSKRMKQPEAAAILGISVTALRSLCRSGGMQVITCS
ncbi:hypothetical protein N2152v2_002387 [Parachlorella kessleri]